LVWSGFEDDFVFFKVKKWLTLVHKVLKPQKDVSKLLKFLEKGWR
jgi:hypothetical protein